MTVSIVREKSELDIPNFVTDRYSTVLQIGSINPDLRNYPSH